MALFVGDTQVSEPVNADENGVYTMTVGASDVLLQSSTEPNTAVTLTAKFVGNTNMSDAKGTVDVNISAVAIAEKDGAIIGCYNESNFADAFKYENRGAVITLMNDVNLTKSLTISGGTFTLIGNGRTITSSSDRYGAIELVNSGKLNITDCAIVSANSHGVYVHSSSMINITNCAITTESSITNAYVVYVDGSKSEANITGSTITSKGNYFSGVYASDDGKVSINDCTITAKGESSYGINLAKSAGEVIINGGDISGTGIGLFFYNANVTINGGKFSGGYGSIKIRNKGSATLDGTLGSVDHKSLFSIF